MLAQLSGDPQPVFAVARLTDRRVKSEILTRHWAHVDFQGCDWSRGSP